MSGNNVNIEKLALLCLGMSIRGLGSLSKFVNNSDVRSKVLSHLAKEPMTTTEIAFLERKHVSHVSRALAEMRAYGLVESVSGSSKEKYYKATENGISIYTRISKIPK